METKTNQAEPKSKKGLGMTLTEAIGELEKGYFIYSLDMDKDAYLYLEDGKVMPKEGSVSVSLEQYKSAFAEIDKSVWYIYTPQLKNSTQQARVELIEKQRLELFANRATIADLTERNGNLTRIVNDQKERIEVLEHENKNYESAIKVLEVKETRINELYLAYEKRNQELEGLMSKATESRERLASKLTNWFLFLVTVIIIEAVFLVKMALENGSKP